MAELLELVNDVSKGSSLRFFFGRRRSRVARKGEKPEKRETAEEEKIGETVFVSRGAEVGIQALHSGVSLLEQSRRKNKDAVSEKGCKGAERRRKRGARWKVGSGGKGKLRESAFVRMHLPKEERKAEKTTKRQSRVLRYVPCKTTIFPSVCLSSSILSSRLFRCLSQRTVFHGPCLPRVAYDQRDFDRNSCRADSVLFVSLFKPGYGIRSRAFIFARYSQAPREERARAALLASDFPTGSSSDSGDAGSREIVTGYGENRRRKKLARRRRRGSND